MAEPGTPEQKTGTAHLLPQLPPVAGKKGLQNFSEFGQLLNTDKEEKDKIYTWWRKQPELDENLGALQAELKKATIPHNEAVFAETALNDELGKALDISNQILAFIGHPSSEFAKRLHDPFSALGFGSRQDAAAKRITDAIDESQEAQETMMLAAAVCAAINETRGVNPDENMIRKKVAQSVFDEMMTQLSYDRIHYKEEIEAEETSIVDSAVSERSELTSALFAKPWSGEQRRKELRQYNKLKRVLGIIGADTEVKVALNTLWKWANGKIPKDGSVFNIMDYADELYGGLDDSLKDAWDAELEHEEDSEEDESEEDN